MRIKYLKGDPRSGMVAEVDSQLAKRLIEKGSAERVADNTAGAQPTLSRERKAILHAAANPAKRTARKAPAKKAAK